MTDEELIARLRSMHWCVTTEQNGVGRSDREVAPAAADHIEALTKERDDYAHKLMQANNTYTEMHVEIERLSDKLAKAVDLLEGWLELASHCSIEEGVCCCGDCMENHSEPMDCGHTPLDHGTYIAIQLAEETRATLAEIKRGQG